MSSKQVSGLCFDTGLIEKNSHEIINIIIMYFHKSGGAASKKK